MSDNSDDYDEKYMKNKFNSDNDLSLKKTLELYNMVIVLSLFSWGSQILLTSFLRWMLV